MHHFEFSEYRIGFIFTNLNKPQDTNFYRYPSIFRIFNRHIGSGIFNFKNLTLNSDLATSKNHRVSGITKKKITFCVLVRHFEFQKSDFRFGFSDPKNINTKAQSNRNSINIFFQDAHCVIEQKWQTFFYAYMRKKKVCHSFTDSERVYSCKVTVTAIRETKISRNNFSYIN